MVTINFTCIYKCLTNQILCHTLFPWKLHTAYAYLYSAHSLLVINEQVGTDLIVNDGIPVLFSFYVFQMFSAAMEDDWNSIYEHRIFDSVDFITYFSTNIINSTENLLNYTQISIVCLI